jgi:hypothetical protein
MVMMERRILLLKLHLISLVFMPRMNGTVNPNFKLTFGIRADYLKYVDNIIRNNAIYELDFGGEKIDTGEWPDAKVQLSPRVGFTWDAMGDQTLKASWWYRYVYRKVAFGILYQYANQLRNGTG